MDQNHSGVLGPAPRAATRSPRHRTTGFTTRRRPFGSRCLPLASAALLVLAVGARASDPRAAVGAVLDDWHQAASVADGDRYFGHFAPGGVFLGTDDGERWTVTEFRDYAAPHFSKGRGWTYTPSARHVAFGGGRVAWVDEKLDNDHYGRLRGTAVLVLRRGAWKIAHYSMSFPVPNEVTKDVVAVIRGER